MEMKTRDSRKLKMLRLMSAVLWTVTIVMVFSSARADSGDTIKVWSSDCYFTWVGEASSPIWSLSVTVNDKPADQNVLKRNNFSGVAHIRIPLEYAKSNMISIRAGNTLVFSADVFYAPTYYARLVPDEYEFKPFHTEENEKYCVSCHRLNVRESDRTPHIPDESICYPCHKVEFPEMKYQHKEAGGTWECLRCHEADARETTYAADAMVKFIVKEEQRVAPLCYQCHERSAKNYSGYKYVHGPVIQAECNMCHNPHGSDLEHLLQKDIAGLCLECHGKQNMLISPNIHRPLTEKGCTGCHDPHGSNFPYFLESEIKDLCLKCHPKTDKQKNNHPVTRHPVSGAKDPAEPGRKFSCISCHDPHASEFDKLLPENEVMMLCIHCHPSK